MNASWAITVAPESAYSGENFRRQISNQIIPGEPVWPVREGKELAES
jgi:hypothetical protein